MDAELYTVILREHSDYIAKVATDLSAQLQQLAQTLGAPESAAAADTAACVDHLDQLQSKLSAETDIFCQRLAALIERTRTQLPSESTRRPEGGRTALLSEPGFHVLIRGTPSYTELTDRTRKAVEQARDAVASSLQSYARTLEVLQRTEELFQHLRARQEHEAEQPPPLSLVQLPPPTTQASASPSKSDPSAEPPTKDDSE